MDKKAYVKDKINQYYKDKFKKECMINKYRKQNMHDIVKKMFENCSKRVGKHLKKFNIEKKHTYLILLGCTLEEFENHIKEKLNDGMNLDNYGEWEIDHIKPVTAFDFTNESELFECCNYKNLNPMWKKDNILKSNNY